MTQLIDNNIQVQLPRYVSHKKVWALKIKQIQYLINTGPSEFGAIIIPEEPGYAPFGVNYEYVEKHRPQVGGYYVVYEDGYKSWSPATAFESGYTLDEL